MARVIRVKRRLEAHTLEDAEELALAGPNVVSFTASLVSQGKFRFYTLTMPTDILAQTCAVDRRHEDSFVGFQRRLDEKRAKAIAKYIDEGLGTIPGSIILSAQAEAELYYARRTRTIHFKKHPKAFLILDGQPLYWMGNTASSVFT